MISTIHRIDSRRTIRALGTRTSLWLTSHTMQNSGAANTSQRNVASGSFPGSSCNIVTGIHATSRISGIADRGMTTGSRCTNSCRPNTNTGRIQMKPWMPIRKANGMPAQIAAIGHSAGATRRQKGAPAEIRTAPTTTSKSKPTGTSRRGQGRGPPGRPRSRR